MYNLEQIKSEREFFRQAVLDGQAYVPLYVKIKVFYGCNLRCSFCNHWRESRDRPLPMEHFHALLTELAGLGTKKVHFSGGEPMLRPGLVGLVEHAYRSGMRVTMTTNGTLIHKENCKQLIQAGLRGVNVSIDSPVRKVHEQVRGVPGSFKATTRAAGYFRRYAHKGKLTLRINTVVSRENYTSLAGIADLAHELGADGLNLIPVDDHCGEHLSMRRKDILLFNQEIAPRIAESALEHGLIKHESEVYPFGREPMEMGLARAGRYSLGFYRAHPCYAPWTHSLVDYNGCVYICCMTREQTPPLGDLKKQSFKEIWEGPAYHLIRSRMHPPALRACQRCDDFIGENREIWEMIGPY
jgi:MoaA/NifB/PqqE/SkfB family radical SAM enzyme